MTSVGAMDEATRLKKAIDCELAHAPDVEAIRRCEEQAAAQSAAAEEAATAALSPAAAFDSTQNLYGWLVSCHIDRMSDRRLCHAARGDLLVALEQGGMAYVAIPRTDGDRYPGSSISVRLDTRPALSTDKSAWLGAEARGIVTRMCRAKRIATRYTNWPWNRYVDNEFSLRGFCDVWGYLQKAINAR
jgi:hypothetical protein